MNRLQSLAVVFLVSAAACLPCAAQASTAICAAVENDPGARTMLAPPPERIDGFEPQVYKSVDGVALRLHVRAPAAKARTGAAPAMLFFFGGAWEVGTVTEFVEPARHFSDRGIVAILVDYRVFCRNGNSIAEEVADAKSAVRYVRQHAVALGVDPHRIVVAGGSAGGHLALATATIPGFEADGEDASTSSAPDLLALLYPCSDVTTDDEKAYGGDAIAGHGKDVSPLYHLRGHLPPMLVVQGTDDIVYQENKALCAQSAQLGNACELVVFEGAPHGFFGPGGKWYAPGLRAMDEYLVKAGYLPR